MKTSSDKLITTKGTKHTKRKCSINLPFLRDLRVLRGAITADRIILDLSDNRILKWYGVKFIE